MKIRNSIRIRTALVVASSVGLVRETTASEGGRARYEETDLVSDVAGMARATDPHLVNAWGLARSPGGPWWVADNGTGVSTLYNGAGAPQPLVVTIPNAASSADASAPTGTVFNGSATDFLVSAGAPAHFLFATEEGTIIGWNSGPQATVMVNRVGSAVYKGLAVAPLNGANCLYAANFQTGEIDVFDRAFQPVTLSATAFHDRRVPANYAPFNVQRIGDSLYVTFAEKESGSIDEVHGPGRGFVDVFTPSGELQHRLQWGAWFNAPWGVVAAPEHFGALSNLVLVGQFGSGKIAAFDDRGAFRGLLRGPRGRPLAIEGLWALGFGNDANAGPSATLYFTAGIDDEAHGLFGTITPRGREHGSDGDASDETSDSPAGH